MAQQEVWEKEYETGTLVSKDDQPQAFMKRYIRRFTFMSGKEPSEWRVLDLGCGTGRNSNHLASLGADVVGVELAKNALDLAQKRADEMGVKVNYIHQSIGEPLPLEDNSFDMILDITSSNSLNEAEREIYIKEAARLLKPGGAFLVRALSLDNDKNAKNLLKLYPGPEKYTYIMPKTGIVERIFLRQDFRKMYAEHFKVKKLQQFATYTPFEGQPYKRFFWFGWFTKLEE
jgi:ubiquinone/menaquinone biosynthesis C-methylase UbiE